MSWVKRQLSPEKDADTKTIAKQSRNDTGKKEPSWLLLNARSPSQNLDHHTDFVLINAIITEVFSKINIRSTYSMFLLHTPSVLRLILYYIPSLYLYYIITVTLTSCVFLIASHYPPTLSYACITITLLKCIISTMSIDIHNYLFIYTFK